MGQVLLDVKHKHQKIMINDIKMISKAYSTNDMYVIMLSLFIAKVHVFIHIPQPIHGAK